MGKNLEMIFAESPLQEGSDDCGVFSCVIARALIKKKPIQINAQNAAYYRRLLFLELVGDNLKFKVFIFDFIFI